MTNHVPTVGRAVGQRCLTCKGAVKWQAGSRPSHVYHQDFTVAAKLGDQGHPVTLESGEPTHYWLPGLNGAPDLSFDAAMPVEEGRAAQEYASTVYNEVLAAWTVTTVDAAGDTVRQDSVDTIEAPGVNPIPVTEVEP